MAEKRQDPKSNSPGHSAEGNPLREILEGGILRRQGKWIGTGVVVLALFISGLFYWKRSARTEKIQENKELGPAFVFFGAGAYDSTVQFIDRFLASSPGGLSSAKALLLKGKSLYMLRRYQEAIAAFDRISVSGDAYSLVQSGADLGHAAALMQLGRYLEAAGRLEAFVARYMHKRPDASPSERLKAEPDGSPSLPGALWKLALCYRQLGEPAQSKSVCERLLRAYAGTDEAALARRLMAVL